MPPWSLESPFSIIPVIPRIPLTFSCVGSPDTWFLLLVLILVEHILQQYPEYLVASFDLEKRAQFWAFCWVSPLPSLRQFLPYSHTSVFRIPSLDVIETWTGPLTILSFLFSYFPHFSFWFYFIGDFLSFYLPTHCRLKNKLLLLIPYFPLIPFLFLFHACLYSFIFWGLVMKLLEIFFSSHIFSFQVTFFLCLLWSLPFLLGKEKEICVKFL